MGSSSSRKNNSRKNGPKKPGRAKKTELRKKLECNRDPKAKRLIKLWMDWW